MSTKKSGGYAYPKNASQWWKLAEDNWIVIEPVLERFLDKKELKSAKSAKESKDSTIITILETIYEKAPDNIVDENLPGWIPMCDLLNEAHVLNPHHVENIII